MPIVVNVVSKEDFAKWLAVQQEAAKAAATQTNAPAAPAAAAL